MAGGRSGAYGAGTEGSGAHASFGSTHAMMKVGEPLIGTKIAEESEAGDEEKEFSQEDTMALLERVSGMERRGKGQGRKRERRGKGQGRQSAHKGLYLGREAVSKRHAWQCGHCVPALPRRHVWYTVHDVPQSWIAGCSWLQHTKPGGGAAS